jgi:hypothetical protein
LRGREVRKTLDVGRAQRFFGDNQCTGAILDLS